MFLVSMPFFPTPNSFFFLFLFCEWRVGSFLPRKPEEPPKSQRYDRKGQLAKRKEFAAAADGNGRDRSGFTWRGCVLAKAEV